jgi:hypothetical protein
MSDIFTNRETAIIIWIAIFAICFLLIKNIRDSAIDVIKTALNKHILGYVTFYLIYICLVTYSFYHFKLWDTNNLKDTSMWFIFTGLQIGYIVVRNKIEIGFWKNLILENLALVEFEKFFINLYNFSFKVELILVPITMLLLLLNFFLKRKEFADKKLDILRYFVNIALICLVLLLLLYSLHSAITNIQSIVNMNTLKSFSLSIVYAVISIPFMYVLKLYSGYEKLLAMLNLGTKRSKELNSLIKRRLILFCRFDIKKLQIAANMNNYNLMAISSKDEIDIAIRSYQNALSRGQVKSENVQNRPTWITLKTAQELTSANIIPSEMTLQFSDSKKEELVGYMTELYSAKEVKVLFIPPSNKSSNGLIAVDYYTDTTPTRTGLNNNLANIVILSESLAEEYGISNPNVSVCAMTMEGIPLGIGNYYSSTGKAMIDVSDCPEL